MTARKIEGAKEARWLRDQAKESLATHPHTTCSTSKAGVPAATTHAAEVDRGAAIRRRLPWPNSGAKACATALVREANILSVGELRQGICGANN